MDKVSSDNSFLVVVDIQERFRPVICGWDETVGNVVKLVRGMQVLELPVVVTEQYPKGLGNTVKEITDVLDVAPIEKITLSCFGSDAFREKIKAFGRKNLILCGIEAHICLLNTTLDALDAGYGVHYVVDAVSSRKKSDKDIAVQRVIQAGACPVSTEMILFQILQKAGTEKFKRVQEIIK
jgi:nicotinamidase-related amidase